MASAREVFDYVEEHTDLDVIAITDHDDIRGALKAREVWARGRYRFGLVTGVEITATEGHVLALYVDEPIQSLRPLKHVLTAIRKQNGLAIAPHPLNQLTRSLNEKTLVRTAVYRDDGLFFDAIETANTSSAAWAWVRKARKLNRTVLNLPEAGGSDAHFLPVIGSAYTAFDGSTGDELRTSIATGNVRSRHGRHPTLMEIGPGQMLRQTWRGLSTTPRTMGLKETAQSFVDRIFSRS